MQAHEWPSLKSFNTFSVSSFNDVFWACSLLQHPPAVSKKIIVSFAHSGCSLCSGKNFLLSLLLFTVCPPGFFGERCEEHCDCMHGSSCHHQTGACHCAKGWRGRHCDKRECLLGICGGRVCSGYALLLDLELMTGSFSFNVALWSHSREAYSVGCNRCIGGE